MSISKNLARVLQQHRLEHHLSIQDLADKIGIPRSSVEGYLNGTGNPRADTLERISQKTGIPRIEIVSDPAPRREQVETIVQAAKELSGLPSERLEEGFHYLHALTALFVEDTHK